MIFARLVTPRSWEYSSICMWRKASSAPPAGTGTDWRSTATAEVKGGRHLAPDLILRQQTADGQTRNREVFESLKPYFDRWMIFDNSVDGRSPVLVEAGGREREKV